MIVVAGVTDTHVRRVEVMTDGELWTRLSIVTTLVFICHDTNTIITCIKRRRVRRDTSNTSVCCPNSI